MSVAGGIFAGGALLAITVLGVPVAVSQLTIDTSHLLFGVFWLGGVAYGWYWLLLGVPMWVTVDANDPLDGALEFRFVLRRERVPMKDLRSVRIGRRFDVELLTESRRFRMIGLTEDTASSLATRLQAVVPNVEVSRWSSRWL